MTRRYIVISLFQHKYSENVTILSHHKTACLTRSVTCSSKSANDICRKQLLSQRKGAKTDLKHHSFQKSQFET